MGGLFFNIIHRYEGGLAHLPIHRRRLIFVTSFAIQTIFILAAASLVATDQVSSRPFVTGTFSSGVNAAHGGITRNGANYLDLLPIALLAFQASGQVCLSRVLGLNELPSTVLSTLYHDFVADLLGMRQAWTSKGSLREFFLDKFKRQEKRFACIVALFLGAMIGGEMYKSPAGMDGALWLAAGLKFGITIAFLVWKKESSFKDEIDTS